MRPFQILYSLKVEVIADISSEECYPLPSSKNKENTGRVKERNNMSNPPPKPKRQFLTPSQDNGSQEECLYAGNRTYQQMENIKGKMRETVENLI